MTSIYRPNSPKCPQCGVDRPAPPHGRYCGCGHDWKPKIRKILCSPSLSPTSFFRQAIGSNHHLVADIGAFGQVTPSKINTVYTEARTRFPEAADIIAALVYEIDRHRQRSQTDL